MTTPEKVRAIIDKAYQRYKCLQREDFFIEFDEKRMMIVLNWHTSMDAYINLRNVRCVGKFLSKHCPGVVLYSAYGKMQFIND